MNDKDELDYNSLIKLHKSIEELKQSSRNLLTMLNAISNIDQININYDKYMIMVEYTKQIDMIAKITSIIERIEERREV